MTAISTPRLAAVFAASLALFLLASFPLALAINLSPLPAHGFHARAVSGSIWSGEAAGAGFGKLMLGDLRLSLSPLPLFGGTARFAFAAPEGAAGTSGAVSAASGSFALDGVDAGVPIPALLPIAGIDAAVTLQDFSTAFENGACRSASGTVSADVRMDQALGGSGSFSLTGNATCAGDKLLVPLTGRTPAGDASLFVHIAGDAGYTYDLKLSPISQDVDAALLASGFAMEGGNLRLRGTGRLQ